MEDKTQKKPFPLFELCLLVVQVVIIVFYAEYGTYGSEVDAQTNSSKQEINNSINLFYPFFQDVHVMIFVGFGFLMTFPYHYMWGAVGVNMLLASLVLQLSILTNSFWHQIWSKDYHDIELNIEKLITGDFVAGSSLIAFGAVLGRTTYMQTLVMGILLTIFFGLNETIGVLEYEAVDMGGSMFVHTFGAYFGVACSWALHLNRKVRVPAPKTTRYSDTFAMIGTLFLWMYWPSFNGALASGNSQHRVVVNTVFALAGSCLTAFVTSKIIHGKFVMGDIQNATLAGGVAVGSSADLVIGPYGALIVGCVAGFICVLGFTFVTPFLARLNIHDTCGVHNLHGLSGVLGGITGAISAAHAGDTTYGDDIGTVFPARANGGRSAAKQAGYQMAALGTTLAIAIAGGFFTGIVLRIMPVLEPSFDDSQEWEVEEDDKKEESIAMELPVIQHAGVLSMV
eukprot:m.36865 g.36865  ORF g.36865 m.36865 type:complete len:454 (-) comp9194_c0_seq1:3102-4463(-)